MLYMLYYTDDDGDHYGPCCQLPMLSWSQPYQHRWNAWLFKMNIFFSKMVAFILSRLKNTWGHHNRGQRGQWVKISASGMEGTLQQHIPVIRNWFNLRIFKRVNWEHSTHVQDEWDITTHISGDKSSFEIWFNQLWPLTLLLYRASKPGWVPQWWLHVADHCLKVIISK